MRGNQPRLEPMLGLEWSQAIELPRVADSATKPAELRRAWVHRAPEKRVLELFRASSRFGGAVPAPWWLRAIAAGTLDSREDGFRVEDRITQLLGPRPGWEFVPWAADGESGYWEFIPSEGGATGYSIPTTVLNTSRHTGWIDVLPAHNGPTPAPLPVAGLAGLRSRLGEFEAIR
ncbi:hypothetical protein CFN78_14125 [Amycolatopsis antarctica]|uniref:Uncharacterized protein n=1 Tax=Amycolatopsis antarctica TaxID=1854586 RepID=A0A263D2S1_9PSEU|nr:hypothetical protein [Amycolatopsis antarctica]OZM72750.1 hypothetical protein CFN78_14125 [Amycolatopsis antarctica]